MASGAIAYDQLATRDPAAIDAVEMLMTHHPDHARFDSALAGHTGDVRARLLFELIARWPDEIRDTPYNRTHWHHELRVVSGWTVFGAIRLGAAESAFDRNWRLLRDGNADPAERAVALCWLFHIVGDMHQPLHAGHRMDRHFPLTDRAGTFGWVRRTPDAAPETFHHFWDSAADRPGDVQEGVNAIAQAAETREAADDVPIAPDAVMAQFRGWERESEHLAASVAYRGSGLKEAPRRAHAPILSPDYVATAGALAETRLGQAGFRLAELLAILFPAGEIRGSGS